MTSFSVPATSAFVKQDSVALGTLLNISATIPYDNTIPQITEGGQVLSKAFAATSPTNIVRVRWTFSVRAVGVPATIIAAIFRSDVANAIKADWRTLEATQFYWGFTLEGTTTPGTTSSITYSGRVGTAAGTNVEMNGNGGAQLLGGVSQNMMFIEELKP